MSGAMSDQPTLGELEGVNEWAFGDDGDKIETWVYRLDESGQRAGRTEGRPAYFRKIYGPIDPEVVRRECGGGEFELKVHVNSKIRMTKRISVLGPRLSDDDVARMTAPPEVTPKPEPAAPSAAAAPALDASALAAVIGSAVVQALAPALERLASQREPQREGMTFENMLALMDRMRPSAPDSTALVKMQTDMLTKGIELARTSGGEGRSLGDAIVETMPHLVETVDKVISARQAAVTFGGAAAPRPGAPAVSAAASPQTVTNLVLAGQVANAMTKHVDPDDFADVLDTLYGEETQKLAHLDPALVLGILRPFAAQFPVLGTDQLEPYVTAVMRSLAQSPADESGDEAGTGA